MGFETLVEEIRLRKNERRALLRELESVSGRSMSQISNWLNGSGYMPDEAVEKIVEFLGGKIHKETPKIEWDRP